MEAQPNRSHCCFSCHATGCCMPEYYHFILPQDMIEAHISPEIPRACSPGTGLFQVAYQVTFAGQSDGQWEPHLNAIFSVCSCVHVGMCLPNMHICVCVCLCLNVCLCPCLCLSTYVCKCGLHMYMYMHICIRVHVSVCVYVYIYICLNVLASQQSSQLAS